MMGLHKAVASPADTVLSELYADFHVVVSTKFGFPVRLPIRKAVWSMGCRCDGVGVTPDPTRAT